MFGKDEVIINNIKVIQCDIDQQPGIASIVGVPNSSFIGLNPFESNLSLLNRTALIKPLAKERRTTGVKNVFSFSSRNLQSKLCYSPTESVKVGANADAMKAFALLVDQLNGRKD